MIGPAAYSDAAGGKRVTESVIAAGADIIFGQGNGSSFGMLQAVETTKAGDGGKVYFIDVIGDKTPIDKGFLLSSVVWNITPVYTAMIEDLKADTFGSQELLDRPQGRFGQAPEDRRTSRTTSGPRSWRCATTIISGKIKVEPIFDAAACAR